MKLTYDKSLADKGRRIIGFYIEPDDSPALLAGRLASMFKSPCAVVYSPFGEHRLPAAKCADVNCFGEILADIKVNRIEIGEGSGRTEIEFIIDFSGKSLDCIGPIEYNFYNALKEHNIDFRL